MGARLGSPLFLVPMLLLAGCAGGEAESPPGTPADNGVVKMDADSGAVTGRVVDDSVNPIVGAQVGLSKTTFQAVTDQNGLFQLGSIPPGQYTLFAGALGFGSVAKQVDVAAGAAVDVVITLIAIPVSVPYTQVFGPFQGYFECRLGIGTQTGECGWVSGTDHPTSLYPNDRSIFRFDIASEDYQTMIGDIRWTQGSLATSTAMRLAFSYDKRDSSHWWCAAEGPSPAQWRYETDGTSKCVNTGSTKTPERPFVKDNPMRTYANVPFPSPTTGNVVYASYQQKFEVMASVFYGEKAPEGYVAFPDQ